MKLKLQNILKVESADIELGGLTVITGENDSGKSSIGKVLFSMLKAANNVKQVDKLKTIGKIRATLFSINNMFVRNSDFELLKDKQAISTDLVEQHLSVEDLFASIRAEAVKREFTTRQIVMLDNAFSRIQQRISEFWNPTLAVAREFNVISRSEFQEPLHSYGTDYSTIHFHDATADANGSEIDVTLEKGEALNIQLSGNSSIEDITYIESPVYLHILDALRWSNPMPGSIYRTIPQINIPYHLTDMAEKVLSTSIEAPDLLAASNNYQSTLDEISELIKGDFAVDKKTKQLYFNRNGIPIPTVSVASGIKSFGMLMQLIKTGSISTSKMLVLDEPEIHLHPEWQISFCKFIIELVAQGIPIVVSSHSPYFIQGLRYFSAARGIEKDVVYYMAEQNPDNGLSRFKDVTHDLNKVFTLLAAPLQEIMNVDAVRNRSK